jgi:hypothetical protein
MKKYSYLNRGSFLARPFMLTCLVWAIDIRPSWCQSQNVCGPLIRQYEAAHGIPHKLLSAISLVESGRKVQGSVIAWPWTINANGKPYVFKTKSEAINMVRRLRQLGVKSIDVGCMQVNLKQHPNAFPNLDAAFDPATNIAYAAKFLKAKKLNTGSWKGAVAHYHSATAKFHTPYRAKVLKTWAKVQNGRMPYLESLDIDQSSSIALFLADMERHKGSFVETIAAPSGRRVSMVVQFAPFKGFAKGARASNRGMLQNTGPKIIQGWSTGPKIIKGREGSGPKVIKGWPTQGGAKIIPIKLGASSNQLPKHIRIIDMTPDIVQISPKKKRPNKLNKRKRAVMSKFRAKSR